MTDPLTARYIALGLQHSIPDTAEYALDWFKLAADCEAANRPATAQNCRNRGGFYAALDYGSFIRKWEGISLVTIIAVPATPRAEQVLLADRDELLLGRA